MSVFCQFQIWTYAFFYWLRYTYNRENTARAAMDGERYSTIQLILDLDCSFRDRLKLQWHWTKEVWPLPEVTITAVILRSHEQKFGAWQSACLYNWLRECCNVSHPSPFFPALPSPHRPWSWFPAPLGLFPPLRALYPPLRSLLWLSHLFSKLSGSSCFASCPSYTLEAVQCFPRSGCHFGNGCNWLCLLQNGAHFQDSARGTYSLLWESEGWSSLLFQDCFPKKMCWKLLRLAETQEWESRPKVYEDPMGLEAEP